MPELPEVETVRRGLAPHLQGRRIAGVRVRNPALRWPIPADLDARAREHRIERLDRRGKYLILRLDAGALILHLGMSGSLRLIRADLPAEKHEHFDLLLDDGQAMRLKDPRRFGAVLWSDAPDRHPLIAHLGVEPLDAVFDGDFLYHASRGRRSNIKQLIMDAHCVVGVGNIYANEALFRAGIRPGLAAGRLSRPRCTRLAQAIKATLNQAIAAGGSTLRDFVDGHGRPGYFQQSYFVYGRADAPCRVCATPIRMQRHGNRATYFCPHCQTG